MNRAHLRALGSDRAGEPSASGLRLVDRVGRGVLLVLLAGAIGCSWNAHVFNPEASPPLFSVALPEGRVSFQINESIPLDVALKVPEGQGRPFAMAAHLMRGNVILDSKFVPDEPTREDGSESIYRVVFEKGLSKPGKYRARVAGMMSLKRIRNGKSIVGEKPTLESEPITFEVTK